MQSGRAAYGAIPQRRSESRWPREAADNLGFFRNFQEAFRIEGR